MLNQVAEQSMERSRLKLRKVARKHLGNSVEVSTSICLFTTHTSQSLHIWDANYKNVLHSTVTTFTLKQAINWIKGL